MFWDGRSIELRAHGKLFGKTEFLRPKGQVFTDRPRGVIYLNPRDPTLLLTKGVVSGDRSVEREEARQRMIAQTPQR